MKRFIPGLAALLFVAAQAAYAHTELVSSTPENKDVLEAAPKEVVLNFSEAVHLTALSLKKADADAQTLGSLPADTRKQFTVALPELGAGRYLVAFRATSGDGHALTGEVAYTVKEAAHGEHGSHAAH